MSPRILFVSHSAALGGAELYLTDVAGKYAESSTVLLFESGPLYDLLTRNRVGVRVLTAPPALLGVNKIDGLLPGLRATPGLVQLVARTSQLARAYDLIYANSQKALIVGALASVLARRPVIWNLHDILTADHFSALNRRVAVQLSNALVSRVIVNSRATMEAFVASGGQAEKARIVYNGLAPGRHSENSQESIVSMRAELGLGDKPVVGVFGRLTWWKGQHVLLHALTMLPGVHALVVGDALFGADRGYKDRLQALSTELGLQDRVHFLGFRDDVWNLLCACDAVVHTSVAPEPFGRVIVEAMLAARPVIATGAGGVAEIIDNERTGLLTPPGDPHALSHALNWVLENRLSARSMAHAARLEAERRFSIEDMLANLEREINVVLKQRSNELRTTYAWK